MSVQATDAVIDDAESVGLASGAPLTQASDDDAESGTSQAAAMSAGAAASSQDPAKQAALLAVKQRLKERSLKIGGTGMTSLTERRDRPQVNHLKMSVPSWQKMFIEGIRVHVLMSKSNKPHKTVSDEFIYCKTENTPAGKNRIYYTSSPPSSVPSVRASAVSAASSLDATRRVALVIGNTDYVSPSSKVGGKGDAKAMEIKLNSLGYNVVTCFDATAVAMDHKMREFLNLFVISVGGPLKAVVFFAGHGATKEGRPVLYGIDNQPSHCLSALRETWTHNTELHPSAVLGIIIDCCRGLQRTPGEADSVPFLRPPANTWIMYPCDDMESAYDGGDGNLGVFTQHVVAELKTEDDIIHVFRRIAARYHDDPRHNKTHAWWQESLKTQRVTL